MIFDKNLFINDEIKDDRTNFKSILIGFMPFASFSFVITKKSS